MDTKIDYNQYDLVDPILIERLKQVRDDALFANPANPNYLGQSYMTKVEFLKFHQEEALKKVQKKRK